MPTDDLVNIYANMNALGEGPLVEPQWINECAVLFYAGELFLHFPLATLRVYHPVMHLAVSVVTGSFGVSRFGDLIYPLMAPTLGGLLLEGYFDFPVGGVDDDAAWTSFMWNRLAEWLVYGPPPPDPAPNKGAQGTAHSARRLREASLSAKKSWVRAVKSQLLRPSARKKSGASAEVEGGLFGAYKTRKSDGLASKAGTYVGMMRSGESSKEAQLLQEKQVADELEVLANSLIDHYLLVLFPHMLEQHSSSTVLAVRRQLRDRAETLARQMVQPETTSPEAEAEAKAQARERVMGAGTAQHEYFGSSLSASVGGDVMVGAPGAGRTGGPQEGAAHLFLSSRRADGADAGKNLRGSGHAASASESITLRGGQGGGVSDAFPSYERFGWSSAACDVTGDGVEDWVVCAPSFGGGRDTDAARGNYTGRCDVFFGPFSSKNSEAVPDASIYGDREWGNFGYAVTAGDVDGDGLADLMISAPYVGSYPEVAPNDRGDLSSQGAVFVYLATSFPKTFNAPDENARFTLQASSAADLVMQRPESFQWFGKSLAVAQVQGRSLLVVGAPAFHSTQQGDENSAVGKIFVYDLSVSHTEHVVGVFGCGHAGRTGQAVIASPDYLVFSEPHYNATAASSASRQAKMEGLRAGRVVAVTWSALLAPSAPSEVRVCELRSVLGEEAVVDSVGEVFEGRYGASLAFSEDSSSVLVGAPLADDTNGRVYSLDLVSGVSKVVLSGRERSRSKGRVGQAIAVSKGAVYVGAPLLSVSDQGEQEGEVYVL
jgi:hypothetical protein